MKKLIVLLLVLSACTIQKESISINNLGTPLNRNGLNGTTFTFLQKKQSNIVYEMMQEELIDSLSNRFIKLGMVPARQNPTYTFLLGIEFHKKNFDVISRTPTYGVTGSEAVVLSDGNQVYIDSRNRYGITGLESRTVNKEYTLRGVHVYVYNGSRTEGKKPRLIAVASKFDENNSFRPYIPLFTAGLMESLCEHMNGEKTLVFRQRNGKNNWTRNDYMNP